MTRRGLHRDNGWLALGQAAFLGAGLALITFGACGGEETSSTSVGGGGGAGAASSSSTVIMASSSSSGTGGSVGLAIGSRCDEDADCADDDCILPSDDSPVLAGGAVSGYCTKTCTLDEDCPTGRCVVPANASEGQCLLTCALGPPLFQLNDALNPGKCRQREDVRCTPASDGDPVCLPMCSNDAQCEGRFCDLRSGMCVDQPANGALPLGTVCDDTVPDEDGCEGLCVGVSGAEAICTQPCVLGGVLEGDDCGGLAQGLCVLAPDEYGAGDDGRCVPGCSAHDDCGNPDWWCFDAPYNPNGNGFCFVADDCPNGEADCPDDTERCIATGLGPKCLEVDLTTCNPGPCEMVFPLTSAGTGGGGQAGGGGGQGGGGGAGTGGAGGA